MATTAFDPQAYKQTTRQQWQDAAEAWHRWGPLLEEWLGEATEAMLDLAGVQPGDRVLDVAAGAGGQTLAAARRVGPERRRARDRHLAEHPRVRRRRGEACRGSRTSRCTSPTGRRSTSPPASFDVAISRRRAHLLPRPRRRRSPSILRGAAPRRPHRGNRRTRRRSATASSRCRSGSSAAAPSCRRPRPACPARSASAQPGVLRVGARGGRVRRRRRPGRRRARAARVRGGVRALRAGVVRCAPPDARRAAGGRAAGRLGRGRAGARAVRGAGRLRRAVRAARRRGHEGVKICGNGYSRGMTDKRLTNSELHLIRLDEEESQRADEPGILELFDDVEARARRGRSTEARPRRVAVRPSR